MFNCYQVWCYFTFRFQPVYKLNPECDVQAKVFTVHDPVAKVAHPMLGDLQKAVPRKVYGSLLVMLLNPDLSKRATAQQALASDFLATAV